MPELGETWTETITKMTSDEDKLNEAMSDYEETGEFNVAKFKTKKDSGETIQLCHTWNGLQWIDWYNNPVGKAVNITFWEPQDE